MFSYCSIGCTDSDEKTPQTSPPPTTPPPPEYTFTAKISGNILDYELKYESGNKPEKLWIELDYHGDLTITGRNLQDDKTIKLESTQGTQGDPYTLSGGKITVKTYRIGITPYFQYPEDEDIPRQLETKKWLEYTPT